MGSTLEASYTTGSGVGQCSIAATTVPSEELPDRTQAVIFCRACDLRPFNSISLAEHTRVFRREAFESFNERWRRATAGRAPASNRLRARPTRSSHFRSRRGPGVRRRAIGPPPRSCIGGKQQSRTRYRVPCDRGMRCRYVAPTNGAPPFAEGVGAPACPLGLLQLVCSACARRPVGEARSSQAAEAARNSYLSGSMCRRVNTMPPTRAQERDAAST